MRAIVDDPASWVEFRIEKGQLQYLNNRQFAHSRTAFKDAGTPQGGVRASHAPALEPRRGLVASRGSLRRLIRSCPR